MEEQEVASVDTKVLGDDRFIDKMLFSTTTSVNPCMLTKIFDKGFEKIVLYANLA